MCVEFGITYDTIAYDVMSDICLLLKLSQLNLANGVKEQKSHEKAKELKTGMLTAQKKWCW